MSDQPAITPCGYESHTWENEQHDDGHIEARCIVCLCWLADVVGHEAAAEVVEGKE